MIVKILKYFIVLSLAFYIQCNSSTAEAQTQVESTIQSPEDLIQYVENDKWGYSTTDKKVIIAPQFEEASPFAKDSSAFDGQVFYYASVKKNGKYGTINEKGAFIIPAEYPNQLYFNQGYCWIANYESTDQKTDKTLIINYKNQRIFSSKKIPGMIRNFSDGLLAVSLLDGQSNVGKLGFIDYGGKVVIPFEYDGNSPVSDWIFQNGRAVLSKNDKLGIIDKNNKVIYPFTIKDANPNGHFIDKDGTAHIMMQDGSFLLIDTKGKLIGKEKSKQ